MLTPNDILGLGGSIARRLDCYELREEQLAMAEAVNLAFIEKRHLLVEAGTGVGKSFAYLIPAILQTAGNQNAQNITNQTPQINVTINPINVTINKSSENIAVTNKEIPDKTSSNREVDFDIPFDRDVPFEYEYPDVYGGVEYGDVDDGDVDDVGELSGDNNSANKILRVVISTHTISLQEQIMEKDVPFLRSVLPFEFTAVLVKGRSNYVCLRRFRLASQRAGTLFGDFQQRQFERIREWLSKTDDGSKSSLTPEPNWEIWAEICCETGNCLGKKCKSYDDCFYNKVRRRIMNAQILIVNHALFFSDLALRMHSGGILPEYNMLIFDEAHTVAQVASDHIGISVTQYQVEYNLHRLYNERLQKGLLVVEGSNGGGGKTDGKTDGKMDGNSDGGANGNMINADDERGGKKKNRQYGAVASNCKVEFSELRKTVTDCLARSEIFFDELADWVNERPGGNGRVREKNIVKNLLSEGLSKLMTGLRRIIEKLIDPGERQEFRSIKDKIESIRNEIDTWINQSLEEESVYWIEVKTGKSKIAINAVPIDVGPILRKHLFEKIPSIIMTSATLTTG
ncbi:MAG: hypothetical protein LBP59_14130 [Planctomycetaceae bacterium]|jgi:ATP-dependent DNA helicase DinG|nr:hypothetical protein [Planctomycetaceae bacterium]